MSSEKRYSVFSYSGTGGGPWDDQRSEGLVDDRSTAEALARAAVTAGRDSGRVIGPAGLVFYWDRDEAAAAGELVQRYLDLSLRHLPPPVAADLNGYDGVIAWRLPHGWLLWVPDDPQAHAGDYADPDDPDAIPAEVVAVQCYARARGCDRVLLVEDGPRLSGLQVWG